MFVRMFRFTTGSLKEVYDCATRVYSAFQMCSHRGLRMRTEKTGYCSFSFTAFQRVLSMESVFAAHYVRGELIAVFAAMPTNVAFQWISVAMATHVDGVHDMV